MEQFLNLETGSGVILLGSAVLALVLANSPLGPLYKDLIYFPIAIGWAGFELKMSLNHWVNDGLMAVFFFVVGLEIKRELVVGSLSSRKLAVLPFMAALGGMIAPACIYVSFNLGEKSLVGWAIPMATDIAFAVGVLAFLSKQVPLSLKIFLLALATIDDLGAVLVIAGVYSSNISGFWLSLSGLFVLCVLCFKHFNIQKLTAYFILGVGLWFCVYKSGVHATVAGVILGLITPVRSLLRKKEIDEQSEKFIPNDQPVKGLLEYGRYIQSPAQFLIDWLHLPVSFIIMPLFAFFNSGLVFDESFSFEQFSSSPVTYGILLGLVLGKPLGIFLFSWLSVKLQWAEWPEGVRPCHIWGVGFLAGIGFTMALFISHLSMQFDPVLENFSKVSIFSASLIAGVVGFIILSRFGKRN